VAALTLALVACYGTLMAVSFLPFIGLTLAVEESMWAGAIILFTGMTVVAVAAGIRKHRFFMPLVLAMVDAGLIGYMLLGLYHCLVELVGFALVADATF
jgi:arsenite methyltransferase